MTYKKEDFETTARPLATDLIDFAKKSGTKKNPVTDVKIVISATDETEIEVEKGQTAREVTGQSQDVSITLYAGSRSISFTKNTLDQEALKTAIKQNIAALKIAPENEDKRLLDAADVYTGSEGNLDLYDESAPDRKTLVDFAKQVEGSAMKVKGTKTTRSVSISENKSHLLVMATNGVDIINSKTLYRAYASVIAEDKNGMQIDGESTIARHFSDLKKATKLGQEAGKNAVSRLSPDLPDTGEYTIILYNDAAQSFFSSVMDSIKGSAVYQGSTFLKDKLNTKILPEDITIVDDPRIKKGLGSRTQDTAGVEAKKVTFIKKGVLKAFNVTLASARKLGVAPIGRQNGITNASVLPGTKTPAELMSDVKYGILIKGFNGGTVNISSGTYSRQAYGLMIKDGKVTKKAVEGFVVSGNLKEMFQNVSIADDTPAHPAGSRLVAPTTRINHVTIAGKKNRKLA